MTYILDTDLFSLAYHAKFGLRERIAAARVADEVVVSVVTRIEALRGRFDAVVKAADGIALTRACEGLLATEAYLNEFRILPFDVNATAAFDRLRLVKKRKTGHADLLIACIALAHDATLVTRNTNDFAHIPNLRIENWAD